MKSWLPKETPPRLHHIFRGQGGEILSTEYQNRSIWSCKAQVRAALEAHQHNYRYQAAAAAASLRWKNGPCAVHFSAKAKHGYPLRSRVEFKKEPNRLLD